jgi:hypothetical protein
LNKVHHHPDRTRAINESFSIIERNLPIQPLRTLAPSLPPFEPIPLENEASFENVPQNLNIQTVDRRGKKKRHLSNDYISTYVIFFFRSSGISFGSIVGKRVFQAKELLLVV